MNPLTPSPAEPVTLTRSEERMVVSTRSSVAEVVRVRRRIVSEERTVQVTVRVEREVLVVEQVPGAGGPVGTGAAEPLVIVLSEQVPEVVLRSRPYERVTVSVAAVQGEEQASQDLRREVVEFLPPTGEAPRSS